jgi:DNA-binding PadR family transcriptional regulator
MGPRGGHFGWSEWASMCGPGFTFTSGSRRRRRRVFERGDLKYVILGLLEEQPMHGYEVMQRLEEESGGYYTASPGSVYPVLQMLEDQGYVRAEERDGKKVYRITPEGSAFLHEHRDRFEDVSDRLEDFASMFGGRGMGDLTRSFMRLAQVSFERAMDAAGDAEAIASLKETLERAALDVEAWRRPAKADGR